MLAACGFKTKITQMEHMHAGSILKPLKWELLPVVTANYPLDLQNVNKREWNWICYFLRMVEPSAILRIILLC